MSGKTRPSQRAKVLSNVDYSNLSYTDKHFIHDMFALAERQQATIDRYEEDIERLRTAFIQEVMDRDAAKAEAIKEVAEELKDYGTLPDLPWDVWETFADAIDSYVKEKVGDT